MASAGWCFWRRACNGVKFSIKRWFLGWRLRLFSRELRRERWFCSSSSLLLLLHDYYQDSSRCDKKVWDIWDEEVEVAVNFSKEGNWVVPQTISYQTVFKIMAHLQTRALPFITISGVFTFSIFILSCFPESILRLQRYWHRVSAEITPQLHCHLSGSDLVILMLNIKLTYGSLKKNQSFI